MAHTKRTFKAARKKAEQQDVTDIQKLYIVVFFNKHNIFIYL